MSADRQALIARIGALRSEVAEAAAGLTPAQLDWQPAGDGWTARQVLAHLGEFPRYFIGELERALADPAVKWGRGMDHPVRLQTVAAGRGEDAAVLRQRADGAFGQVVGVLERTSDADLDREAEHVNPKFGRRSMRWLVEHFIVEHAEGHLGQIRRNLSQMQAATRD